MAVFENVCVELESKGENELNTLQELHTMMREMVGDVSEGRDDVVGFTKFCELLRNAFLSDRNEGEGSDAERLVRKTAGLIMAKIREMETDRSVYPTYNLQAQMAMKSAENGAGLAGDEESSENSKSNLFKMPALTMKKKSVAVTNAFTEIESKESNQGDNSATTVSVTTSKAQVEVAKDKDQKAKGSSKPKVFSPAERLKETEAVIPYKEPDWGGLSMMPYSFEVVKNGIVVEKIDLSVKSFHVFGRLPSCDHSMDHPSLSRYHAVVQHCKLPSTAGNELRIGWYLYDLDSTHGTWINKNKVPPRTYLPLRVGYVIKFGGSSRLHILQGPDNDQDEESELSVAEMKAQRDRQLKEAEVIRQLEAIEAQDRAQRKIKEQHDVGCTWGFDDDAEAADSDEEDSNTVSAIPLQEELYIDDPKKALRGFFEREGWDLPEYEFTDAGKGQHMCRVEIPIDTPTGEPIVAEVTQTGSRKDAVVACALQACRVLDRHGLLRKSTHESRAKKGKNWEEADFYDSDEDTFLDRTGDIEKKRQKRIMRVKPTSKTPETYESLMKKLEPIESELNEAEKRLEQDRSEKQAIEDEAEDALDAFMMSIKSGGMDTRTRSQLKHRCVELRQQQLQLQRLIKLVQPCDLPPLTAKSDMTKESKLSQEAQQSFKASLPIIGKIKTAPVVKPAQRTAQIEPVLNENEGAEVEEEDEDEDGETVSASKTKVETPPKSCAMLKATDRIEESSAVELQATTPVSKSPLVNSDKTVARKRKLEEKGKNVKLTSSIKFDDNDPDLVTWVPPSNQKGDGRTHLNDKFGY